MAFGDRIKEKRASLGYSQQKLAEKAGISLRSIQNYESNQRYPNNINIVKNIAVALGTTAEFLMAEEDAYIISAAEKGGSAAQRDVEGLLGDLNALFAGGVMSSEDKDKVMRAIMDIYWESKNEKGKASSCKYRKEEAEL